VLRFKKWLVTVALPARAWRALHGEEKEWDIGN
jgi:hypothetical protein